MKEGKYIIFENGDCLVFDRTEIHSWMAKKVHSHPVSAGFFEVVDGKVTPFGHSTTLGIRSRLADAWIIKRVLATAPQPYTPQGCCEKCGGIDRKGFIKICASATCPCHKKAPQEDNKQ